MLHLEICLLPGSTALPLFTHKFAEPAIPDHRLDFFLGGSWWQRWWGRSNAPGSKHADEFARDEHVREQQHTEIERLQCEDHRSHHRWPHNRKPYREGNRKRLGFPPAIEHHELAPQTEKHRLEPKSQRADEEN